MKEKYTSLLIKPFLFGGSLIKYVALSLPLAVYNDVTVSVYWGGWCTPQIHGHAELQNVASLELGSLKAT